MLKELFEMFAPLAMQELVAFWRATGTNLALAEPLVDLCAQSNWSSSSSMGLQSDQWHLLLAQKLLKNTMRPLLYQETTSLLDYAAQFVNENSRWETLGIFSIAALRATMDVQFFPALYKTEQRKRHFRMQLERLIAFSLEICLKLDCLNDLQLVLQYETCIVHSHMNGDLSEYLILSSK